MYSVQTKRPIFKIICLGLSFVFVFSQIFPSPAWAARSKAGGGELAEFDFGDFALSAGMSLGSMALGAAFNAGLSSLFGAAADSGFGSGIYTPGRFTIVPEGIPSLTPG